MRVYDILLLWPSETASAIIHVYGCSVRSVRTVTRRYVATDASKELDVVVRRVRNHVWSSSCLRRLRVTSPRPQRHPLHTRRSTRPIFGAEKARGNKNEQNEGDKAGERHSNERCAKPNAREPPRWPSVLIVERWRRRWRANKVPLVVWRIVCSWNSRSQKMDNFQQRVYSLLSSTIRVAITNKWKRFCSGAFAVGTALRPTDISNSTAAGL